MNQPPFQIPRVRRCKNPYRNCQNIARKQTGNAYEDKICNECLVRRREKQALTASQPTCHCGNRMGHGKEQCGGCDYHDEQLRLAEQRRVDRLEHDLLVIAERNPELIEEAFNRLINQQIRSLRKDYP